MELDRVIAESIVGHGVRVLMGDEGGIEVSHCKEACGEWEQGVRKIIRLFCCLLYPFFASTSDPFVSKRPLSTRLVRKSALGA